MTKIFATALTIATLASTAAFADSLTTGSAHQAPVFAFASGTASLASDIGSARTAPIYALKSGNSSLVADIGTATRAPAFARIRQQPAAVAFVK